MKSQFKYYEEIKRTFPRTMSKDQFYQVAHISKATALYLLQSGLVPCKDSGKKTRLYTISNRDVQTITIPNTVVRLNGQAFNHCKKLEQVILEESSRLIFPAGVFRGCPRLNMPPKGID